MITQIIRLLLLLNLTQAISLAVVVTTGVTGGGNGDFVHFQVNQTVNGSDYTCFIFERVDETQFGAGRCLDESLDLFYVSYGDHFTSESVRHDPLPLFLGVSQPFVPESSFYMGIYTPTRYFNLPTTLPQAIGWARISYVNGTFAVLDSAIDFSGQGLIVGTTTVIPEGSTFGAVSLFLLGLSTRRKRTG
jgi:hypothetical protein